MTANRGFNNCDDKLATESKKTFALCACSDDLPYPLPPYTELYPDVDEAYRPCWQQSDEHLPEDEEWLSLLTTTAKAMQRVIDLCKKTGSHNRAHHA